MTAHPTNHLTNAQALNKLEQFLERQEQGYKNVVPEFDQEEIAALRKVILLVKGLEALGSFAGFVKSTVIWLGVIIGAFIAVKNGAVEFIVQSVATGSK